MTITVELNPTFNTLNNGSQRLRVRQNSVTKERRAVVDVEFNSESYVTGGITVDFSSIRGFTQVYMIGITHVGGHSHLISFVPGADNDAATARFELFVPTTGVEVADTTSTSLIATVEIYGV